MNPTDRKTALETKLTALLGAPVEITVRGPLAFTLSAEGDARVAMEKAKAFLSASGQVSGWQVLYDAECDFTCAFFTVADCPRAAPAETPVFDVFRHTRNEIFGDAVREALK